MREKRLTVDLENAVLHVMQNGCSSCKSRNSQLVSAVRTLAKPS